MFRNALRASRIARLAALAAALAALCAPSAVAHDGWEHPVLPANETIETLRLFSRAPLFTGSRTIPNQIGGAGTKVECVGDGTAGKRVQVIYVRATDAPDAYLASKEEIGAGVLDADRVFRESAALASGSRHIRFVHDASCNLSILNVVLDPAALDADDPYSLRLTKDAMVALGYSDPNRKYLLFVDHAADHDDDVNCGVGELYWDDSDSDSNLSNGLGFARIGPACWNKSNGESTVAHELMHTFGAVQPSAPNFSGNFYSGGHCLDNWDRMCYADTEGILASIVCPTRVPDERHFDCLGNDYFDPTPAPGTYLDTHWNTADSRYLADAPANLWGFAKADQPTATSYTPSSDFNQSSTNAKNTVERISTGIYEVSFTNLAGLGVGNTTGVPLVTAVGGAGEYCTHQFWVANASPERVVTVRCYDAAGNAADVPFTAGYVRPISTSGDYAHLYANQATAASYTPTTTHQFNSSGGLNTITRSSTGVYEVRLPGLGAQGGTVKVTAYSSTGICKVDSWRRAGADELVNVVCFDRLGSPLDVLFTMVYANGTSILGGSGPSGYAYANDASASSYTPDPATQYNSTGASNTVTRSGQGLYRVTMPGLGVPYVNANRGTVHVTSYTSTSKRCQVTNWSASIPLNGGASPLVIDIACHTTSGAPADSKFVVQYAS